MAKTEKPDDAIDEMEEQKRKQAMVDYDSHLEDVTALKAMTDTAAWKRFYAGMKADIARHGEDVLDAEKPRDVVKHQEGVKLLRGLISRVQTPVDELNLYAHSMPLFSPEMKIRAQWNDALGQVELKGIGK